MNVKVYYPHKHGLHWFGIEGVSESAVYDATSIVKEHLENDGFLEPSPTGPMLVLLQGGKA